MYIPAQELLSSHFEAGFTILGSLEPFSHENSLRFLSDHFCQDLIPVQIDECEDISTPADTDLLPLPESTNISTSVTSSQPLSTANLTPTTLDTFLEQTDTTSSILDSPSDLTACPTPSSIATATPMATLEFPTLATKSNTNQSILRLVKAHNGSQSPTRLELIHMIDTGGQPEYMENMPSLIHSCHLAVLVMSLQYDVDDHPSIHYHEEGKEYKRALQSQYSSRQIIQKLAATLQAKRFSKEGESFRLVTVATHRDCVWKFKLGSRIRAYHQALSNILLPACEKELIPFTANEIPFVLNLKKPTKDDLDKLDLIREKISESGVGEVVKTPGVFMIFEQELTEYALKAGRNIVSLDECLEIGIKLKMTPDRVMSALIFFHRQFTFLYFRDVLPNLVFIQPQVPLDCINAIVQFSYKVEAGVLKAVTKELLSSLRDGIITEEILSRQDLSKCFIPNLYEPNHAIDLLCHTLTLAPLSREPQPKSANTPNVENKPSPPVKREEREYLMMSLRQPIPDKDIPQYIPASSDIAPLVIQFAKNCVPLSCFGRTISCLLAIYDWKLSRADDGSLDCLASNVVSLYDSQLPVQIILRDTTSHLEVHIRQDKGFTCDQ